MIREYAFYCIPNKFNEYDAKYKLYYSHDNKHEFIGYADTVAEAKKRARLFFELLFHVREDFSSLRVGHTNF